MPAGPERVMSEIPAAYTDAPRWPFGDSPELADELLALVLAGGKRATAVHVSVADFAELGKLVSDLGDAEMMARAWR